MNHGGPKQRRNIRSTLKCRCQFTGNDLTNENRKQKLLPYVKIIFLSQVLQMFIKDSWGVGRLGSLVPYKGMLVGVEFNRSVNTTIKFMLSRSVYLATPFLGIYMVKQYLCTFFLEQLTPALFMCPPHPRLPPAPHTHKSGKGIMLASLKF